MGEKAAQKKSYIRHVARGVFMEKGYKSVTMKDIVEACGISRGGLYLYYPDTETLFLDVLRMETEDTDEVFSARLLKRATASEILTLFLEEQKKELLRAEGTLAVATYEYAFLKKKENSDNTYLLQRFRDGREIIGRLIERGVRSGEFVCADPKGAADNVLYALEGMGIVAQTRGLTEKEADREIRYLLEGLLAAERKP